MEFSGLNSTRPACSLAIIAGMTHCKALLIDIDGVLTVSWRALPGAVEAVHELRALGLPMRFLTNTTSRTRRVLSETLTRAGIDIPPAEIMSAAVATATYVRTVYPGARCFVLTNGEVTEEFAGINLVGPTEAADVVVMGGAGVEYSHDALNGVFRQLQEGAQLVSMHRNLYWQTGNRLTLDTGAYLTGLEMAAGAKVTVIGKPAPEFFKAALEDLNLPATPAIVMVGDDLEADIAGAKGIGLTSLLVRTGKFRQADYDRATVKPDAVIDSISDLPAWLAQHK